MHPSCWNSFCTAGSSSTTCTVSFAHAVGRGIVCAMFAPGWGASRRGRDRPSPLSDIRRRVGKARSQRVPNGVALDRAGCRREPCAAMRPPAFLFSVTVLLSALLSAGGCNRDQAAGGRPVIAVVPKGTQHEFWKSVHAGAAAAAAAAGVDVQWNGPQLEGDRASQIQLLQNFISKRVQGIVLAPVDQVAIATVVAEAKAAGVPTVVIDSALDGDAHVAYVATDNKEGGRVAAARMGELLAGKGKVVMLRFQQGSASTMAREAGFLEALAARSPGVQVISDEQYAGDLDKARAAADSLLVAHPDVDGVFCPNESTTHGFLLALQSCGK